MLTVAKDTFRLLTFRTTREEFLAFDRRHLGFGLICTWLVGIGRYWDNPRAEFLQHLGVGSVVYVFVLALFLLFFIAPLKARDWSYFRILTFVSLVSPPAVLYAVPVEKFVSMGTANMINAWFLLVVATWRAALLVFALRRFFSMSAFSAVTATFLPLGLIVLGLASLNLERAVFNIMGGFTEPTPNDSAYLALLIILYVSILLSPVLLIAYVALVVKKLRSRNGHLNIKDESDD